MSRLVHGFGAYEVHERGDGLFDVIRGDLFARSADIVVSSGRSLKEAMWIAGILGDVVGILETPEVGYDG